MSSKKTIDKYPKRRHWSSLEMITCIVFKHGYGNLKRRQKSSFETSINASFKTTRNRLLIWYVPSLNTVTQTPKDDTQSSFNTIINAAF